MVVLTCCHLLVRTGYNTTGDTGRICQSAGDSRMGGRRGWRQFCFRHRRAGRRRATSAFFPAHHFHHEPLTPSCGSTDASVGSEASLVRDSARRPGSCLSWLCLLGVAPSGVLFRSTALPFCPIRRPRARLSSLAERCRARPPRTAPALREHALPCGPAAGLSLAGHCHVNGARCARMWTPCCSVLRVVLAGRRVPAVPEPLTSAVIARHWARKLISTAAASPTTHPSRTSRFAGLARSPSMAAPTPPPRGTSSKFSFSSVGWEPGGEPPQPVSVQFEEFDTSSSFRC